MKQFLKGFILKINTMMAFGQPDLRLNLERGILQNGEKITPKNSGIAVDIEFAV